MLYFFYDHLLDDDLRADLLSTPSDAIRSPSRAIARHVRLQFHELDHRFESAVPDLAQEANKFVTGAVIDISPGVLDAIERHYDLGGRQRRVRGVSVLVPGASDYRVAVTHVSESIEWVGLSPTRDYIDRIVRAAGSVGASERYLRELLSFAPIIDREAILAA
jgi:hypothetical protein